MRDAKKQWRTWMDRLVAYRNFVTQLGLLHLKPDDPHLIWADAREIAGIRVGIAGFNSAWSCVDDDDKGKLWCGGDWQISQLEDRIGPVAFSIALIHHPGNWFTAYEDPSMTRRLRREFPLLLHGHEHQEWVEVDADHHCIISAGACYDSTWMPNGYSIGQIDIESLNGAIHLRQWDNSGGGWVPRDVASRTREGIWPLPGLTWINSGTSEREAIAAEIEPVFDQKNPETEVSPEIHFTRRFCQHVIDQHDVLELFGCDIPRELQRHQLSVAYVSLNLSCGEENESLPTARGFINDRSSALFPEGYDGVEANKSGDSSTGIESILDDVAEHSGRLIIMGPAGAGKSTLLRWCAIQAACDVLSGPMIFSKASRIVQDEEILKEWNRFKDENPVAVAASWRWKIPVLIRLRDCSGGKLPSADDIPRFLAKHLPAAPAGWMTSVLDSGRALILLDGVDEVHRDQRRQLAEEIAELIRTYPHCTYVITTRAGAVESGWLEHLNFTEARVEPMSRVDREEFIDKWYQSAAMELKNRPRPGEDILRTASQLKMELTDQPELGVLSSNPLLCAMICALYRERQERLPETPAELSEALVQMLLHRRERETPGLSDAHFLSTWRALQYTQKKGLLSELARSMVSQGDSSIDMTSAGQIVGNVLASTPGRNRDESKDILQALLERSGILRPSGNDRLDFPHNTLKES